MRKGENLGQQFLQAKKLRFREVVIWHLGSHSQWQPKQNLNQKLEIQDVISLCHPAFVSRHMGNISYLHIILLFGTLLFFLGLLSFLYIRLKLSLIVLPAQSPQTLEILASSYTANLCIVFRFPCSPGQNPDYDVLPSPSFLSSLVFCLAQRFVPS